MTGCDTGLVREHALSQFEQNLQLAYDLSHDILRLAQQKQWSELQQLERKRMQLLEAVFSDPELTRNKAIEDQIQQIISLNDRTVALCEDARKDVMQDGKKLKLGKEAIQAYRKQTRD
jgi:hypothetical protein